jgi:hypothetical protein
MFGPKWEKINQHFSTILKERTRTNLKDKFRLLNELEHEVLFKKAEKVFYSPFRISLEK